MNNLIKIRNYLCGFVAFVMLWLMSLYFILLVLKIEAPAFLVLSGAIVFQVFYVIKYLTRNIWDET